MLKWKRTILHAGVSLTVAAGGALLVGGVASAHDASDHDAMANQFARGQVTVNGTGSFTVETHKGTTEVIDTTSTTKFVEPGAPTPPTGVMVGEDVVVSLDSTATTPTATKVLIELDHFSGKVTAFTSTSITLSVRRHATKDVLISSNTMYFSGKTTATGVADGEFVIAFGLRDTTAPNELDGLYVYIAPTPPLPPKPLVSPPKLNPGNGPTKGDDGTGPGNPWGGGHQHGPMQPPPIPANVSPGSAPAGSPGNGQGGFGPGDAKGVPSGGPGGHGGPGQGPGGFSGGGFGNGGH